MSIYPFLAMPGMAMTEPPISANPPTGKVSVSYRQPSFPILTTLVHEKRERVLAVLFQQFFGHSQHPVRLESGPQAFVMEKISLLASIPVASSSKPNARTMVRVGLKFFSSIVSIDELLRINLKVRQRGQNHIQYSNQSTFVTGAFSSPDELAYRSLFII